VYNVFCKGILLDFRGKETHYPQLLSNDYAFTQQVGKRISLEGHPGILTPSARKSDGVNVVAFSERILSNPRVSHYLSYYINPLTRCVRVEKELSKTYLDIEFT